MFFEKSQELVRLHINRLYLNRPHNVLIKHPSWTLHPAGKFALDPA